MLPADHISRRKLILRILLWSLAIAAASGIMAVLLPMADDIAWRLMGTGLITAVTAGIALPMSFLLGREQGRRVGLFGLVALVGQFLLALVMLWGDPYMSSKVTEQVGLTMLFGALVGIPCLALLWFVATDRGRVAGIVGLGLAALCFGALMIADWWRVNRWSMHDDWAETGGAIGGVGTFIVLALLGVGTSERRRLPLALLPPAGAVTGALSIVLIVADIWRNLIADELIVATTSAAGLVAYVNLVLLAPLSTAQSRVRLAAIAAATVTAIGLNLLFHVDQSGSFAGRLTVAAAIATGCGSMAIVVFLAFNRRTEVSHRSPEMGTLTIVCPNCRRRQDVPTGRSACADCGLRMNIRIEEPRCPQCDYLLYRITSDRCPECGIPLAGGRAVGAEPPEQAAN